MASNVADVYSSNPLFNNWLKAHMGLDSVHNALRYTTEETIRTFHDGLLNKPLCGSCCNDDLTRKKKKDSWRLPCEICNGWMIAIKSESKGFGCIWINTEIAKWEKHYWEIAKVFMTIPNKKNTSTGPETDDCMKLLQLCMNCDLFEKTQQEKEVIKEVIEIRCKLMHPISLTLEDDAAENYLDSMINLMSAKFLKTRHAADALKQLNKLRYDKFDFVRAGGDAQPSETLISMEDNGSIREQYENNISHMRRSMEENRRDIQRLNQSFEELVPLLKQLDVGGKEGHAKSPQDPGRASGAGAGDFKGATPKIRSMGVAGPMAEAQLLPIVEAAGDGDPGPSPMSYVAQLKMECEKMNAAQLDRNQEVGFSYQSKNKSKGSKIEYVRDIVVKWRFRTPEGEEHKTEASAQKALARRILTNFYSESYRDYDLDKCRQRLQMEHNMRCRDKTPLDYKGKKIAKSWVVALTCKFVVEGDGATRASTAIENVTQLCLEKLKGFL